MTVDSKTPPELTCYRNSVLLSCLSFGCKYSELGNWQGHVKSTQYLADIPNAWNFTLTWHEVSELGNQYV